MRRILATTGLAAALALGGLAPTDAFARDRHGYGRYDRYDRHHHGRHRDRDNDAALAAGAIGLVLGLALGAAAASDDNGPRRVDCRDNYQRCAPPAYDQGYYDAPNDRYSAYEDDYGDYAGGASYGAPPPDARGGCVHQVEQWDPVAGRYAVVNLRRPCDG